MNNRIGLLLKVKDVTASKFAEMIGVQPSNISHLLSGRNKPSLDFILKVCETFPDISIDWLMFGKGVMFKSETYSDTVSSESEKIKDVEKFAETQSGSSIPDLFSQDYPSENSIVDSESTSDGQNFIENDEKENKPEELVNDKNQSGDLFNSSEEVISEKEKLEEKNETKNEENKEVISEERKSENDTKKTVLPLKPVKMILVYADETFEILNLKE